MGGSAPEYEKLRDKLYAHERHCEEFRRLHEDIPVAVVKAWKRSDELTKACIELFEAAGPGHAECAMLLATANDSLRKVRNELQQTKRDHLATIAEVKRLGRENQKLVRDSQQAAKDLEVRIEAVTRLTREKNELDGKVRALQSKMRRPEV